ncbi:helix-turn-helix domain-containing protein [Streptomyces himalayensis]|uniref:Helix-turn-helix domain-containing protein n=1 Tax=Streptomyces himalayensis subsp. himalayensis TaxID=2756131 RepID=A0A7W0IB41_9ACTN|nr:helix-turn-helix transcriptional regulator [Streptomyces himalayensis]MBA2948993.1 helix-turn-helix domain-containing protein [Streptomyces himalayensis subsp. himalayensis]
MPQPSPLPTARRRRLGTELRRLRERADLSATEAAVLVGATQSRISNIEAGRYGVSADRVRTLARHYACTDGELVDALAAMTGERRRGWWEEYRDILSPTMLDLTELEHHATALRVAQVINIPGLLQTSEHARALFAQTVPALKPHEIEHRVSHRVKRQAVLHREQPPPYTAILHEAALRMRFGDRATTRAQLAHLIEMSELDHVTVLVVPFDSGPFHTSGQGIDYFHSPVRQLDTVQIDTDHGGELIDSPAQLERYRLVLDRMSAAALAPPKSRDFIAQLIQNV